MSQGLIQAQDCCTPCADIPITQIPGPPGEDGQDGTNGTDGVNAFTLTTAQFTMPAVEALVTVDVVDSTWMAVGQIIFVENAGYFRVDSIPDGTSVSLLNMGYNGNVAPATIVPLGQAVSPGGLAGLDGTSPPASTLNDLSPTTTKGDVLVDNGANSPSANVVRLAAGADGTIFATDSGQPTGRKQVALTPNAATDNILPRFDSSGNTTPTPLQASGLLVSDTGAIQSTPTGGNARGASAVDLQVVRGAATQVASGANSCIPGGENNTASGANSIAAGTTNVASASGAIAIGNGSTASAILAVALGDTNTASDANALALGSNSTASAAQSVAIGDTHVVSGIGSAALGGSQAIVDGANATSVGGLFNIAHGDYSLAMGHLCVTDTNMEASVAMGAECLTEITGQFGFASGLGSKSNMYGQRSHASGYFTGKGDAQAAQLVYRILTTDATANVEMFLDGGTGPFKATMWDFSSWAFHFITVARNLSNSLSAVWETKGGIKRSAGPISLIGVVSHALICNDGEGWMVAGAVLVDADVADVALRIQVTGQIATDIRWVSYCRLVQIAEV